MGTQDYSGAYPLQGVEPPREGRTIRRATVAWLLAAAVAAGSLGAPPVRAATVADIAAEANWILAMQVTSGPDAGLIRSNAGHDAVPYFSNIAASGLAAATRATGNPAYVAAAWNWLDWYAAHMNASGFVTNYRWDGMRWVSTGTFDSTDGYAGTFLTAVRDAYAADPNTARLAALWPAVGKAVDAILATKDSDWLTYARPGWPHKYLMDNVEAYEGFRAVEELAGAAMPDARLRALAGTWASNMPAALEIFWNPAQGGYDSAISNTGVRYPFNWNALYPIVTAQAWMLRTGLVSPSRASSITARIEATHPSWDLSGQQNGAAWWPEIIDGMRWAGNASRAATATSRMSAAMVAGGRAWPYHVGNTGRIILAMAGEPDTHALVSPPAYRQPGAVGVAFTGVTGIATGGTVQFECSLDGASFAACGSPLETGALTDGLHTLRVRAVDASGARDPAPLSMSWTVDATPPSVTLTSVPAGTPAAPGHAAPEFRFTGSDAIASADLLTYECAADAGAPVPCRSPAVVPITGTGTHTVRIVARDPAGNVGAAATHTWFADGTLPQTAITSGPSGVTGGGAAELVFDGSDDLGSVSFECRVGLAGYAPCTSPVTVDVDEGTWTFQVRAIDGAGNRDATPATRTWYVDRTPPATVLLETPPAWSRVTTARFTFTAVDNVASSAMITYQCSLDGAAFTLCVTPRTWSNLTAGPHTVEVRAVDGAGLVDPTPERYTWTIDPAAPTGTIQTPDGWVLAAASPALSRTVSGSAADQASGVASVMVIYAPVDVGGAGTVAVSAAVTCTDETRRSCVWTADAPAARGRYRASAVVTDRAMNEAPTAPAAIGVLVV